MIADAARVPFSLHVGADAASGDDAAWIALVRGGLDDAPLGYTLSAAALSLPGLALVKVDVLADPDGSSGISYHPHVLLRRTDDGAWQYVHVMAALGGSAAPITLADAGLRVAGCDAEAERAVMGVGWAERAAMVDARCTSLEPLVAEAFLSSAQGAALETSTLALLEMLTEAMQSGRSFRVARARSDVDRDVRWRSGASLEPWRVEREPLAVSASGTMLFGRTWHRFALRVDASGLSLESAPVADANSHGVPP